MNVQGAWKLWVSRQLRKLILALSAILTASLVWNIRQYTLIQRQHQRIAAFEQEEAARANAKADQQAARIRKNAEWAAADARVQQLYREIDSLSRINAHLVEKPPAQRRGRQR